jgi:hypothetical protein
LDSKYDVGGWKLPSLEEAEAIYDGSLSKQVKSKLDLLFPGHHALQTNFKDYKYEAWTSSRKGNTPKLVRCLLSRGGCKGQDATFNFVNGKSGGSIGDVYSMAYFCMTDRWQKDVFD